jgi:hypothetical protein
VVLAWAAMATFPLVLPTLAPSSLSLLVSFGAAVDSFGMESTVTNGQWGGPVFFFIMRPGELFLPSWKYAPSVPRAVHQIGGKNGASRGKISLSFL